MILIPQAHRRSNKNMCNISKSNAGYSLIELLLVLTIITIMSAVTGYYLTFHKQAYRADDQALQIIDILQEARQRSLTQRLTMRVEIDMTTNSVKLYNEQTPTTTNDDVLIRQVSLMPVDQVIIDKKPSEITETPPEPIPTGDAEFKTSTYPSSNSHKVCTMRFQSDGKVTDAAGVTTGNNLYVWMPNKTDPTKSDIARAITVIGSTGSIRLWEYVVTSPDNNKWKDSRRTAGYGGS